MSNMSSDAARCTRSESEVHNGKLPEIEANTVRSYGANQAEREDLMPLSIIFQPNIGAFIITCYTIVGGSLLYL